MRIVGDGSRGGGEDVKSSFGGSEGRVHMKSATEMRPTGCRTGMDSLRVKRAGWTLKRELETIVMR